MTYKIYVDLAFGWAFIINLILLYVSEHLLGNDVRLRRLCVDALLISIVCTALYVMLYGCSRVLQNTLYVLTYFLLLYMSYRLRSSKASLLFTYAVYMLTGFAIALLLMLAHYSLKKGTSQTVTLAICIICAVPAIYIAHCFRKQLTSCKACVHRVELSICGKSFLSDAYMDTGNSLTDLSGRDVMITDFSYAGKLLGSAYIDVLDAYRQQRSFDYVRANSISDIFFRPVPYRTVSSDFCLMPGFTADSVLYKETGRLYRNITIAISPNRLRLAENVQLLSNRNLKP